MMVFMPFPCESKRNSVTFFGPGEFFKSIRTDRFFSGESKRQKITIKPKLKSNALYLLISINTIKYNITYINRT